MLSHEKDNIAVDLCSNPVIWTMLFKISDFFTTKGGMIEPTCQKILKINDENKTIEIFDATMVAKTPV
jgi:hypothetical protein